MQKLFTIAEKEKEKQFEKFDKKLTTKLGGAATAKSWSDLLPLMKDLLSFLKLNFEYDFNDINDKLLLGKRLAQCLNPECPSGLHEVTLEVYEIILNNIISRYKDKLMDNLYIYSYGLFPFFPNATLQNKKKFLDKIVKGIFTKLNGIELKLCLPGLLSSLIPGMDDNNEETTKNIYSSFNELAKKDTRSFFGIYWMLLLRCKHLRNSGIKYLLENCMKYDDIKVLSSSEQSDIIENQFPNINTTVVNALCEIVKEPEVPLIRNGMDFIITRLPLSKDNTILNKEAKIILINSALYLFVKNEASAIRRLKIWILGLENADDDVNFESEDMKYRMELVIEAFKIVFKQNQNCEPDIIKNNILIFERFLDMEEEIVNQVLSSVAFLVLKSVVDYWGIKLDSSMQVFEKDPIILQITKFFNKNEKFMECLWESLALSVSQVQDIANIDDILIPLKFCLLCINFTSYNQRIKFYIPIIINLLNLIKKIPIKREEFKNLKNVIFISLAYIKTLQDEIIDDKDPEGCVADELFKKVVDEDYLSTPVQLLRKSVITDMINDDENNEEEESEAYKISEKSNRKNILKYDEKLLENLSDNISKFQEYYIGILNEFLNIGNPDNKNRQVTRAEITFFHQIAELVIRLQEYNQTEENEIPKWVKYIEKIIFNYNDNDNILQIEAANILLDLNLSFSKNDKDSIYTKIRNNFSSDEIDNQIIEVNPIIDIVKKMKVKTNCYELLLAKFYLLTNKQSHMSSNMGILFKMFKFDKNKFGDIINNTLNTTENLYENIKLFNNFWKSVNESYPEEKLFKKETVFKMVDFLGDTNPTLRHLSKTWLNQGNQHFDKIIDPILLELLHREIIFDINKNENLEQSEFIKEFEISKILDAWNKLKNIIINSQIMNFFKVTYVKNDILNMIRFTKYDSKMNYLQTLICSLLHYIKSKAKDNLNEEFKKNVFLLNETSTEFLEFLLKNINDNDFLITGTKLINETILNALMESLKEKNEVMSVQLLDVLKSLYFNYPPEIVKNDKYQKKYIELLLNTNLEKVIKDGIGFENFYIREHFISFTKTLVESFFNAICIEDKKSLQKFYNSCNQFIEPLIIGLEKKVTIENKIKIDTEKFSHYDNQNNKVIYKNYCEEYKEYKTYDESEILSILKGINEILSKCFTNQIQEKNKELGTDKGIKIFLIPIPFIKKMTIMKTDFQGNWLEHKKKLANDIKTDNAFVSFFTTMFDFVDENPNKEIKDMSSKLYHNQIFNLLNSFLTIWVNQSDKYERYDYCLNPNGILAGINADNFKDSPQVQVNQAKDVIKNNPIKSLIIAIANSLFITDSIKFVENIISLWTQEYSDEILEGNKEKDKQYKLSIIELLIAMNIPMDVILFCVGVFLQKNFANNNKKKYIKNKADKCYITPLDISVREAKIFHFIYSYILLSPNRYWKKIESDRLGINEIWKEILNIINSTLNESKILYSFCWLYEILQLTSQKYSLSNIDNREIKNGAENAFISITNKLCDAVFNEKTDSKYNNGSKLVLPFLPHVYTNIVKDLYQDDDLYHKKIEGSKTTNQGVTINAFKYKSCSDTLDKKMTLFSNGEHEKKAVKPRSSKTSLSQSMSIPTKHKVEQAETPDNVSKFYRLIIKYPKLLNEIDIDDNDNIIDKDNLNKFHNFMAFITLKENFYPLIKLIFEDNIKNVSKYYNDIILKLKTLIEKLNSNNFFCEYAHGFLADLMEKSPKNVSTCGKDALIEYIKGPKLFKGTPSELHNWKIIIKLFSQHYLEILESLLNEMSDKNIFTKKTEEEKGKILRRVSFIIYSCENDFFSKNFSLIKSRAKKLLSNFSSNNYLEREIFLLLRMLFLRFSHDAVMQMIRDLWPIIFTELVININNFIKENKNFGTVLEPFKFIELLSLVNIEEFSLYQWIFMMDTFDKKDCEAKNDSLCEKLLEDKTSLFKPLTLEIIKNNKKQFSEEIFVEEKKEKSELIIDARDDKEFKEQIFKFFYSIGDKNCFKVKANLDQIAENIENDFIDGTGRKNI